MRTIVLAFKGPLQSYGTDSHFEIRHSDSYPSKSAILGLLAAAEGIRREETERIEELKALHIAVRVDQIGHLDKDYQIASKHKANGDFERNYVTSRYYLEDSAFLVAIEGDDRLITKLYESLQSPYFQLFLGRRSCPVNFDFIVGVYDGGAIEQIRSQAWIASPWYQRRIKKDRVRLDVYADQVCIPSGQSKSLRRDEPVSFSQMGRKHNLRFEAHERIDIVNPLYKELENNTEHDVFASLGEG